MINSIISFGCSFSCWRHDFTKGFVDLVANDYGVQYQNHSIPGNSNESIIYEFNKRYHQYELKDSLILFQPTFLTRYAYYDSKFRNLISLQNMVNPNNGDEVVSNFQAMFGDGNGESIEFYEKKLELFRDYQKYLYNDDYEYNKLLYSLYNIQSSVEKIGSKIIFIYFDTWYKSTPMFNKINFLRFGNELSCLNWAKKNDLTYSKEDLHLSEEGNKVLAEKILSMGHSME